MAENLGMKAVVVCEHGVDGHYGNLVDDRVAYPHNPSGHDLMVKVTAISVNPVDTKIRASIAAASSNVSDLEPRILGWDAVGEVVAVGDAVELFHVGERVWYAGDVTRSGSYAEYELVDERIVGHAPASLDDAHAAAMPLTGLTAWEALFDKFGLACHKQSDEHLKLQQGVLMVVGAAGGVGSMIIQFAKALAGLHVIALASREESQQWAHNMGADDVVDYHEADVAGHIRRLAPGGVDWIFSAYSKGNMGLYAKIAKPFGQIVAIDDEHNLDWYSLKDKSLSWHWEFMFARAKHHAADMIQQHVILESLSQLVDSGIIRSTMTSHLQGINADTLQQAHSMVESGHMVGKVTLTR